MSDVAVSIHKPQDPKPLNRLQKIIYGSGDWSRASFNSLRQFFYAIFLTDVVGLDPRLASIAALVSILWDAINDPLVGALSDRVQTRWGRRRPFLLIFSIPFGLAFLLLWWAPPWQSQAALMAHVTLAYMIADTLQTLVTVPYLSLTPELAPTYDGRTSLTSYRMFFNLVASLLTAASAPTILESAVAGGASQQQAYLLIAAIFGSVALIPYLVIFFTLRERPVPEAEKLAHKEPISWVKIVQRLWQNIPFRYAAGIYVLNWVTFDILALMLPYFILYWVEGGNLLAQADVFGAKVALETLIIGGALSVSVIAIPLCNWLAIRFGKQKTYIISLIFWSIIQATIFMVQPGQVTFSLILCLLLGYSISVAHVIPEAIFPDVIDWGELITHERQEGIYYGAFNFIRRLGTALAVAFSLQVLGWLRYTAPPAGMTQFTQPPSALLGIRLLTGPILILFLLGAMALTYKFPLTRERQERIQHSIRRRESADHSS
jgi:glycoside/pentoside/hexuronide:cation symporter, GPH family